MGIVTKDMCPYCNGQGFDVDKRSSDEMSNAKCPQCKGSGKSKDVDKDLL